MSSSGKWSSQKIDEIVEEYNKTGKMPKNNPFYEGKVEWRAPNLNYSYTREELVEMAKCQENILHFAETKCNVMTDDGITLVRLRPYQKRVLLQYKKFRFNVFLASRQIGKCITFDTNIDIFDSLRNQNITIPMFEFHYQYKKNKKFVDYIEWGIYRLMYRVKMKMNRLSA